MLQPLKNVLMLILLTAPRPAAVRQMKWSEIDLDAAVWNAPPESNKRGKALRLPLRTRALGIVTNAPRGEGPYVFSPDGKGLRPYTDTSLTGPLRKWFRKNPELKPHTANDLRRTARTIMAVKQVPEHIAEMVMGHAVGSEVARAYNVWDYAPHIHNALDAIDEHVTDCVLGV